MTAPGSSTWDSTVVNASTANHRPSANTDFYGAAYQDRADNPPNPATMPSAGVWNTLLLTLASIGAVAANANISITYSGGNPGIDSQGNAAGVTSGASAPAYTVIRTVGGASHGDIFIYWPTGALPASLTRPIAYLNGAAPGMISADRYTDGTNVGVRIVALNSSAAATDLPFTVSLY